MKSKTEEINNLLKSNEILLDIKKVANSILDYNFPSQNNEYTIEEAVVDFNKVRDVLISSIENKILDNYSLNNRNQIQQHLDQIKNLGKNILGGKNNSIEFLRAIEDLRNIVFNNLNLDLRAKKTLNFNKQANQLKDLQIKYTNIISEIERAHNLYNKTKEKVETIQNRFDESNSIGKELKAIKEDVIEKNEQINKLNSSIEKNKDIIDIQFKEIKSYHQDIDNYKKTIDELTNNTKNLIEQNEDIHKRIQSMLGDATGGALSERFEKRKKDFKNPVLFWLWGTIVFSIIFIVGGGIVYFDLRDGIQDGFIFFSKVVLLFPMLIAIWFFSKNYDKNKALMEDYAFKSTMALTLDTYREVLNQELENNGDSKVYTFLTKHMDSIYSSPLENVKLHNERSKDFYQLMKDKLEQTNSKNENE